MATLADSLVTTITTEWGNGGGGGAAPAKIVALVDYRKDITATTEQIVIRLPIHEDRKLINDKYANVTHKVSIRVKTTTSDTRLYEIVDELRWIINNVALTGITRQFCSGGEDKTDSSRQIFIYEMRVTCEEHVASSAAAYSASSATTFEVDELTVNTSIAGSPTAALGPTTITGDASLTGDLTITGNDIITPGTLSLKVSGDTDDYLQVLTDANTTSLKAIGSHVLRVESDHAGWVTLALYESAFANTEFAWDKTNNRTRLYSRGAIDIMPSNDTDDYITISTTTNEVKIDGVGCDLTLDSDTAAAEITLSQIQDLMMFGSANAAWVPCALNILGDPATGKASAGGQIYNTGAGDMTLLYLLPLPTVKGSLKLYVTGWKYGLEDADVDDFVTEIEIRGITSTSTEVVSNLTDYNSAGVKSDTFAAEDMSAYDHVIVSIKCSNTDASDLDVHNPKLQCYYAT